MMMKHSEPVDPEDIGVEYMIGQDGEVVIEEEMTKGLNIASRMGLFEEQNTGQLIPDPELPTEARDVGSMAQNYSRFFMQP